jgi:Brp/Blh family beta-carotene 15,15'-monooxygenase
MKNREALWSTAAFLGTLAALLIGRTGTLPAVWWLAPWIFSLVLFGLPHGALDHEVLLRLWWRPPPPRWALGAILAGYVALSALVILGWFGAPTAVFAGFILLTWAHWGLADLWWSWRRDPTYFSSRWHQGIFAAWRGALPMLVPLACDPKMYRQTAAGVCNLFLRQPADFRWLELDATRGAALGIALALGGWDFALARRRSADRGLNLAEGMALLMFFGLLPALVSVGFYFAFWHGLRHVRRLMAWEELSWIGFARQATPATLGALVMLGALALVTRHYEDGFGLVGVYLALIAALTVPHALVVTLLDVREGLWRSG